MKAPKTTIWSITPVTRAKHSILRQYLSWWLPYTLERYNEAYILDGFAGPGEYEEGDNGSPLIALDIVCNTVPSGKRSRAHMLFIEKLQRRTVHLHKLITRKYPDLCTHETSPYEIRKGSFSSVVDSHLTRLRMYSKTLAPVFVFADPFGFKDIPMYTLAALVQQPACDLFITFMYEEVNRFLSHPNKNVQHHFHNLFGNKQWQTLINDEEREEKICRLYCDNMKQMSNVKYACKFRMMNSGNRIDYFLFFFTNAIDSLDAMKNVFWEVDPEYGTTFCHKDQQYEQLSLFPTLSHYEQFQFDLLNHFKNNIVPFPDLDEYILSNTIFCRSRYKEHLLKPLEQEGRITVVSTNPSRQFGEYTERERIDFHEKH